MLRESLVAFQLIGIIILICPTNRAKIDNNILLERVEHKVLDESLFAFHKLEFRPIAPNVYRHNMTLVLTRPLPSGWIHFVLYHKYATYQKFLIDIWEDFCAFWDGAANSPLSAMALQNARSIGVNFSFALKCPLSGTLMVTHSRYNMSQSVFPLMSAGRYRFDISYAKHRDVKPYLLTQFYFRISDLRVWF